MIAYFIYSSVSLALLLFVYRVFLEKEKRFTFNRVFLLWSLVFSLLIPMIPVGLAPLEMPWSAFFSSGETVSVPNYQNIEDLRLDSEVPDTVIENNSASISRETLFKIAFILYVSISALLLIRLIRIIRRIQLTINGNRTRFIRGCKVVLLTENVIPHTFLNTIFLNRRQFESGKIPDEVINHEFTHVRQRHSLDILFVEFLKAIFWFNPLLYFYKNAIALNHEYLADEAVLSKGTNIKDYQRMLLKIMEGNSIHSLASTFNFSLTKRRLQMMTQSKTNVKFLIKVGMIVPLFAGLSLMLGCEPASNETSPDIDTSDKLSIEILEDNSLLVNENRMTLDELDSLLSEMPESPGLVRMKVSPDAKFGVVTDVQGILREHEAFIINYSSNESDDSSELTLPPAPPEPQAPIETQNLMRILMNSDGRLLMNEEPAELNEVKENIKQFLDNSSTDPREAVISIKTIPDTPYDQYLDLLNEVRGAYYELRNEAAQDQFGMAYSNLEENSSERETIKEMYPGKLSVVPPETGNQEFKSSDEVQNLRSVMEKAREERSQAYNEFVNLNYQKISKEKLQNSYSELREISKRSHDAAVAYYQAIGKTAPPPPPIPPKPAKLQNQ
ncbi:M56 family metallopeptidase [Gracilimonas halophila]|uniref:M56 family metallopeptidase n=1 Tax=Gracilimonas halophila TaxID=1834464 RepID=A0ABW5JF04_9BACT